MLLAHTRHAEILAFPGIPHFGRAFALHKLLGVARAATLVHGNVEHREQPCIFDAQQHLLVYDRLLKGALCTRLPFLRGVLV